MPERTTYDRGLPLPHDPRSGWWRMIPDHLIDKAARAFHESSTFNVVAWDRLGKNTVTRTMPRKYARAILEAVAAEIYDEGYEHGRGDGECMSYTRPGERPYRASEE